MSKERIFAKYMPEGSDSPNPAELGIDTEKLAHPPAHEHSRPRSRISPQAARTEAFAQLFAGAAAQPRPEPTIPTPEPTQPPQTDFLELGTRLRNTEDEDEKKRIIEQMQQFNPLNSGQADYKTAQEAAVAEQPHVQQTEKVLDITRQVVDITPELMSDLQHQSVDQIRERIKAAKAIGDDEDEQRLAAMLLLKKSGYKLGDGDVDALIERLNQENQAEGEKHRFARAVDEKDQPVYKDGKPVIQITDAETGAPRGQFTYEAEGYANKVEAKNAGTGFEIPGGKNRAELEGWIENYLRTAEDRSLFRSPELIELVKTALTEYQITGPGGTPLADNVQKNIKEDLVEKVDARGHLSLMGYQLEIGDPKGYAGEMTSKFDDIKNYLWNKMDFNLTAPAGAPPAWPPGLAYNSTNLIKALVRIMEEPPTPPPGWGSTYAGAYFRGDVGRVGEIDTIIQHFIPNPAGGITRDTLLDRARIKKAAENLIAITGMASVYVGPFDPAIGLIELDILRRTDAAGVYNPDERPDRINALGPLVRAAGPGAPPPPVGTAFVEAPPGSGNYYRRSNGDIAYQKNENYNRFWREVRRNSINRFQQLIGGRNSIRFPSRDKWYLRRLFYPGEHYDANNMGKAASLRADIDFYARALPILNGVKSTTEYMNLDDGSGDAGSGATFPSYHYGSIIEKASDLYGVAQSLLNEPIKGERTAGGPKEVGNNLANLTKYMEGLKAVTKPGNSETLIYYGSSRIFESVIGWLNSGEPDRVKEFPNLPKFSRELINSLANNSFFTDFWNDRKRSETLEALDASNAKVFGWIKLLKTTRGYLWEMLGAFFKALGIGK